jgi:hypothetical protein
MTFISAHPAVVGRVSPPLVSVRIKPFPDCISPAFEYEIPQEADAESPPAFTPMNFTRTKIAGMLFAAAGVIILFSSLVSYVHTRSYLHTATKIDVRVARFFEGYNGTRYSKPLQFPVFVWRDAAGKRQEIYSSIGHSPAAYKWGDKVTLLLNPESRRDSKPYTFWNVWFKPMELLGTGIASLLFGGFVLLAARSE